MQRHILRLISPNSTARNIFSRRLATEVATKTQNIFNPTPEHAELRRMLRSFVESEVDPQALEFNRTETFNIELFRKLGNLGLLGITVDPQYGGSGMDAVAACIAHGIESALYIFFHLLNFHSLL
jgi:alkylation response protein AidB-like acyl-CoA dehydrogenase